MKSLRLSWLFLLCPLFAGCGGGAAAGGGTGGSGSNGGPTTVTIKFSGATPTAVAAQIGSGSFTPMSVTSNALTLTLPAGTDKFAVAYVCQTVNGAGSAQTTSTFQNAIEASTLDGTSFSQGCGSSPLSNTATLTGDVDGSAISGVNYVGVTAGNGNSSQGYFLSGSSSNFSLSMPEGTDRLALGGYVYTSTNQLGANSVWTLGAIRNFEGVAVPGAVNGGSTVVLGASDAVSQQPITYKNVPSGYSSPNTVGFYIWANSQGIMLSNGLTTEYPAVPASASESGDSYSFQSTTTMSLPSGLFRELWVGTATASGGPLTVSFPAPWDYAGPSPAAQPVFDLSTLGMNGKTGVAVTGELVWNDGTTEIENSVTATGNYLSNSSTLKMPSLSGLTGFAAPPPSGTEVVWFAGATQSSAGSLQPIGQNGTTFGVTSSGVYTVP